MIYVKIKEVVNSMIISAKDNFKSRMKDGS